jgi:hypothetical protein
VCPQSPGPTITIDDSNVAPAWFTLVDPTTVDCLTGSTLCIRYANLSDYTGGPIMTNNQLTLKITAGSHEGQIIITFDCDFIPFVDPLLTIVDTFELASGIESSFALSSSFNK